MCMNYFLLFYKNNPKILILSASELDFRTTLGVPYLFRQT